MKKAQRKALVGRYLISVYSTQFFQVVKIRDVKELQQDIENDPITKDEMVSRGCFFFGPVLVAVHIGKNLDLAMIAQRLSMSKAKAMKMIK